LWFADAIGEDPSAKVFGEGDVGVDAEGVGEAPCADVLTKAGCFNFFKVLTKALLQRYLVKAMLV
jgi:hypothetical protein